MPSPKSKDKAELKKVLEEVAKRTQKKKGLDWETLMFGPQRDFIQDPSLLKAACCGRRAGKSHGISLAMVKACVENPGSKALYINMNRASAKNIIHPPIKKINAELELGLTFNNQTSEIRFPNGSAILVFGGGSLREIDKIRGIVDVSLMCVDEAQGFGGDMQYMLSEVLMPSAWDLNAPVLLTGTPNRTCSGPFFNVLQGLSPSGDKIKGKRSTWSTHHWTMLKNEHIDDREQKLVQFMVDNGWDEASPGFRREGLGIWERDGEGLCFELPGSCYIDKFDPKAADDFRYVLGVDLGTADPCAFTTLAVSQQLATTFVVESFRLGDLSTLQAGAQIDRLMDHWDYSSIVVDSGGQGAAFIKQWKDSHPWIPARPVKKGHNSVDMGISIINADMRAGKIKIVRPTCKHLWEEMSELAWDDRKALQGKRVVRAGSSFPDHAADSFRYAYSKVRNYVTMYEYDKLKPGDSGYVEWWIAQRKAEALKEPVRKDDFKETFWGRLVD